MDEPVIIDTIQAHCIIEGDWITHGGKNLRVVSVEDFGDEITFECLTETEDEESITVPWNEKIGVLGWI